LKKNINAYPKGLKKKRKKRNLFFGKNLLTLNLKPTNFLAKIRDAGLFGLAILFV
jgi:hypothetical protein